MAILELTTSNFEQTIANNNFVIIDFWAPWCAPCRSFAPVFERVAKDYPDIIFAKLNTENESSIAMHFQIRSIPTLMVFRDQIIIYVQPGALPEQMLRQLVENSKGIDMDNVRKQMVEEKSKS